MKAETLVEDGSTACFSGSREGESGVLLLDGELGVSLEVGRTDVVGGSAVFMVGEVVASTEFGEWRIPG